jgi:hypothetical protein
MNTATEVLLSDHLKQLKLTAILRNYPLLARHRHGKTDWNMRIFCYP